MEDTNEEQRATTLLNIIIELTQKLNAAEANAKKYERWWLDELATSGDLRKKYERDVNGKEII